MANLPAEHGNAGTWGGLLNAYLSVGHRSDGAHRLGRVVTESGVDNTGTADAGTGINTVINTSSPGEAILFPGGTYRIETPVRLLANRAYLALGDVTFKQKANTELDALVTIHPAEAVPRRNILWFGIKLDGNRANNTVYTAGSGYTKNRGLVLTAVQFSTFIGFAARACGNDGLVFTGLSLSFNDTSSTNHFLSPYIYDCGRYGVVFDTYSDDNHLFDPDIGYCDYDAALFRAGSSSIRGGTLWGSKYDSGVTIGASSNQLIGCQIEGHAQHGVVLTEYGDYAMIHGCKIYDNSLASTKAYDGIYVQGTNANPVKYATITGNFVYSGIAAFGATTEHRSSVNLGSYHASCNVSGNNTELAGGATGYYSTVNGLTAGDTYNGQLLCTSTARPDDLPPGEISFEEDTAQFFHYAQGRGYERLVTSGHGTDGGTIPITSAGQSYLDVSFAASRGDTVYTPFVAPSWNTTVWISNKTSAGFRANFGTTTPSSGTLDWGLVRQGVS